MVQRAGREDLSAVAELAALLWPDHTAGELADIFWGIMSGGNAQFFLSCVRGVPIGFAQCQLRRDYVEGTDSSPVGYLEGIFVREEYRRRGHARELVSACEAWAQENGCREFASDCEWANDASRAFHLQVGFSEVGRIICFAKRLPQHEKSREESHDAKDLPGDRDSRSEG